MARQALEAEITLASLDELLPVANRVPFVRLGFGPVALAADRRK